MKISKLLVASLLFVVVALMVANAYLTDKPQIAESNEEIAIDELQVVVSNKKIVADKLQVKEINTNKSVEWPQVAEFNKRIKDVGMACFINHNGYGAGYFTIIIMFYADGGGRVRMPGFHPKDEQMKYKMTRNGEIRIVLQDDGEVFPPMILRRDADSMFLEFLDTSTSPGNQETPEFDEDFFRMFPFRFVTEQY